MSLSQFPVRAVAVSTRSLIGVSNVGASQMIDAHRERDVSNGALCFLPEPQGQGAFLPTFFCGPLCSARTPPPE
jgi:hypothetical protein